MSESQASTSNDTTGHPRAPSLRFTTSTDNATLRRTKSAKHRHSFLNQILQRIGRPATIDLGTTSALPASIGVDPPSGLSNHSSTSSNSIQLSFPVCSPECELVPGHDHVAVATTSSHHRSSSRRQKTSKRISRPEEPSCQQWINLSEDERAYLKYARALLTKPSEKSDDANSLCSVCCLTMYDVYTASEIATSQDYDIPPSLAMASTSSSSCMPSTSSAPPPEDFSGTYQLSVSRTSIHIPIVPLNSCFSFCPFGEHRACLRCWREHVSTRIVNYQMHKMPCVVCQERVEFAAVRSLLHMGFMSESAHMEGGRAETQLLMRERAEALIQQYDRFILQLALARDPDTRWCPKGGCGYAVIASNCDDCPNLYCLRPGCLTMFCYHCREFAHSGKCKRRMKRSSAAGATNALSAGDDGIRVYAAGEGLDLEAGVGGKVKKRRRRFRWFWQRSKKSDSKKSAGRDGAAGREAIMTDEGEVKNCPRCHTYVLKANDGTCNHMTCVACGCEFCWLCMREVNDMHYLSVSGCTFWGKTQWRPEKRIVWQLGTLLGAPIGVGFLAILAIPAIIFGLPILAGRRAYQVYKPENRHKRRFVTVLAAFGTFLLSPLVAALVIGLGVPTILAFIYVVMPFSMIRSCTCWSRCCFESDATSDDDEDSEAPPEELQPERFPETHLPSRQGDMVDSDTATRVESKPDVDVTLNRVVVDVEVNMSSSHNNSHSGISVAGTEVSSSSHAGIMPSDSGSPERHHADA